jgi:hypothetical protein
MLSVSRMALSLDPLAPRIGSAERRNRALRLFQDAQQRVADCATKLGTPMPPPDVQAVGTKLASQAPNANDRSLRDNPDLIEDLFSVAAGAITVTSKWCGAQHPEDDAVAALAQLHGARP